MEQQLQANAIRIQILEQENTALYTSIVKLRQRAQHKDTRVRGGTFVNWCVLHINLFSHVGFVDVENDIRLCIQQEASSWSLSLPNTSVEEQQNHPTQMQKSPL